MYTSSQNGWTCGPAAEVSVPGSKRSRRVATPLVGSLARMRSNRPATWPPIAAVHPTSSTGKNSRSGLGTPVEDHLLVGYRPGGQACITRELGELLEGLARDGRVVV